MTNLVEAKLAREAQIAYATVAMVTDYDCWHPDHDNVTVEMVIQWFHSEYRAGPKHPDRSGAARRQIARRQGPLRSSVRRHDAEGTLARRHG